MDHRQYEAWLLSEEPLTENQSQSLKNHLSTCDACSALEIAWREVNDRFERSVTLAPEPGFVGRWEVRLEADLAKRHRRQSWVIIGLNVFMAVILFILLAAQVFPILQSPSSLIIQATQGLGDLLSFVNIIEKVFASLFRVLPGIIPFTWWVAILASFGGLLALWIATIKQFALKQGVLK